MPQISPRNILFHQSSGFLSPSRKKVWQWNSNESRDKTEEKNRRRISDEKERRIAPVKGEARGYLPWDEK